MTDNAFNKAQQELAAIRRRAAEIEKAYPNGRLPLTREDLKTMTADQTADRWDEVQALLSTAREVTPEMLADPGQLTAEEVADHWPEIVNAAEAAKGTE